MPDGQIEIAPNPNGTTTPVNGWHWVGYSLIIAVLLILALNGAWFMHSNHISDPRVYIAITLTSLFVLATTTTLAIIFLWGAKVLDLDKTFMNWLGGATVAEVAGILTIIVNFYFAKPTPTLQAPTPAPVVQQQSVQQRSALPQQPETHSAGVSANASKPPANSAPPQQLAMQARAAQQ
jgi:hypothetical protein